MPARLFHRLLGGCAGALVLVSPAWSFGLPGFLEVKWNVPRAAAVASLSQRFTQTDPETTEGDATFAGTFAGYENCQIIASIGMKGFDGASVILPKIDRSAVWMRFAHLADSLSDKYGAPSKVQFIATGNKPLTLPGVKATRQGFDANGELLVNKVAAKQGKVRYTWIADDKKHNVMLTLIGPSEISANQVLTYVVYQQADAVSGIWDADDYASEL